MRRDPSAFENPYAAFLPAADRFEQRCLKDDPLLRRARAMCEAATKITDDLEASLPRAASAPPKSAPPAPPPPLVVSDEEAQLMAKAKALLADYDPANAQPSKPSNYDPYRSSILAKQRANTAKKNAARGKK